MRFIYVDESGDTGQGGSDHFILSGLIIDATNWRSYLDSLHSIRRAIKSQYGIGVRTELHGSELFYPRGSSSFSSMSGRKERLALYAYFLQEVAARLNSARIINVYVDKQKIDWDDPKSADFEYQAWRRLLERYQTHLKKDCGDDTGMIFADETNENKLRSLVRKLRVYNHIPSQFQGSASRPIPLDRIIEDPIIRDSYQSWFIQIADLISHALYRKLLPKGSLKRFNADRLFDLADPILLKAASKRDPQGIVRM